MSGLTTNKLQFTGEKSPVVVNRSAESNVQHSLLVCVPTQVGDWAYSSHFVAEGGIVVVGQPSNVERLVRVIITICKITMSLLINEVICESNGFFSMERAILRGIITIMYL